MARRLITCARKSSASWLSAASPNLNSRPYPEAIGRLTKKAKLAAGGRHIPTLGARTRRHRDRAWADSPKTGTQRRPLPAVGPGDDRWVRAPLPHHGGAPAPELAKTSPRPRQERGAGLQTATGAADEKGNSGHARERTGFPARCYRGYGRLRARADAAHGRPCCFGRRDCGRHEEGRLIPTASPCARMAPELVREKQLADRRHKANEAKHARKFNRY